MVVSVERKKHTKTKENLVTKMEKNELTRCCFNCKRLRHDKPDANGEVRYKCTKYTSFSTDGIKWEDMTLDNMTEAETKDSTYCLKFLQKQ